LTALDALADCLAWLEHGASLDECLERHPEHQEELGELLALVGLIQRSAPEVEPDAEAKDRMAAQLRRLTEPAVETSTTEGTEREIRE